MSLDQKTVKRIATLARIKLNPDRIESLQHDLNRILDFIEELNEVDTSQVDLLGDGTFSTLSFRKDTVNDGGYVDKILSNAPEVACNMFVVPKVVE
jgi:aspartyl-tRNA(Asn)/glutamyl-tRNA(Gln) amidotransferase subunit C